MNTLELEYWTKDDLIEITQNGFTKNPLMEWGELICPFCDNVISSEGKTISEGDQCWKCNAEITKILDY